jgi:hypothetical protein
MVHMVSLAYTLTKHMMKKTEKWEKSLHFLQSQASGERISSQKLSMGKKETTGRFGKIHIVEEALEVLE